MAKHSEYSQTTNEHFLDADFFLNYGMALIRRANIGSTEIKLRRYKAFYGASPSVSSLLWSKLREILPSDCKKEHLFRALNFLRTYSTEAVRAALFGVDKKR